MPLPPIDNDFLIQFLTGLLNNPSPTGFAEPAVGFTGEALIVYPDLKLERTPKGALLASWPGKRNDLPRAITAHADTLGAMVKEIKANGRLRLTQIGSYPWNTVEGENVTLFTASGDQRRGTLLLDKASAHIFGSTKIEETRRSADTLEVRLDECTTCADETRKLGIEVGDFVAFDPRVEVINNFIRSRHLDNKAGVACIVAAVKAIHDGGQTPLHKTTIYISNYEEVGHGGAQGIPSDVVELLTVDMAAAGDGQNSDEYHASLCVKDSGGPYHHGFSQRLRQLAEIYNIAYKVDIYPYYGSDGEAYWRSGGDGAVALIGPGIDASHNYERTHLDALVATTQWIMAFLLN